MKYLALIPGMYTACSRLKTPRDFLYLAATQIVPGIWIVFRLSGSGIWPSALSYALGYLSFIAIYELGYLMNDAWDAYRTPGGRRRIDFRTSWAYIAAFCTVRLLACAYILVSFPPTDGMIQHALLLAILAIIFVLHNATSKNAIRVATFPQLCLLRYMLPILYGVGQKHITDIFIISSLFYLSVRYLAFLDSKHILILPDRNSSYFWASYMLCIAPIVIALHLVAKVELMPEMYVYYLGLSAGSAALSLLKPRQARSS